jgi:hypothetical protein
MHLIGKSFCAAAFVASVVVAQVPQQRDVLIVASPVGSISGSGVAVGMAGPAGTTSGTSGAVGMAQPGPQRTMMGFGFSAFGAKTVTGSPYSAEGATEYTRTLPDGTRIARTSSSVVHRDGQGRTRQEHSVEILGPLPLSSESSQMITITDPVAKAVYFLNTATKTATQLPLPGEASQPVLYTERSDQTSNDGKREVIQKEIRFESGGGTFSAGTAKGEFKNESLGKSTVEGVLAEGTRSTHVIPTGQIGNDRPITIVTETWYSPELQTVVSSRTSDPMNGDTSYRLTKINRTEPAASLFQVPPDYTLKQSSELNMIRRILATPKPKQ